MDKLSYLSNAHPEYIESLYQAYQNNPEAVDSGWRKFFEGFEFALSGNGHMLSETTVSDQQDSQRRHLSQKETNVLNLINAYRTRGHFFTKTNPVRERRKYTPTLDIQNFDLETDDLDTIFQSGTEIGLGPARLKNIIDHLQQTYCHSIGAEYRFIRIPERLQWLQTRMEYTRNTPHFSLKEKRHILEKLNQAVVFENFLHTKYVGQKRFSLSGGETLIPALDAIIEKGAKLGVEEFVIGMAHRGRLNVLANILKKSYQDIFAEFEGEGHVSAIFAGDVKYHLGYSSKIGTAAGKKVLMNMVANPSHLEAVNPVVEGVVRARLDQRYSSDVDKIVPILIHGDAAIAAQGIAYEVIQMSLNEGFKTGGTIHLVINNQIGFTTNYLDGRSSTYCTDVAKVTLSPVFHVNADDVEAVIYTILLAMEYRQTFHTDVFIDLLGYRKYGHNESDEPRFTQPKLYSTIARHSDPRKIYSDKLVKSGTVEEGLAKHMEKEFEELLQYRLEQAKSEHLSVEESGFTEEWADYRSPQGNDFLKSPETGIPEMQLFEIGKKLFGIPEEIKIFRKLRKLYNERLSQFQKKRTADWAIGETLAYATLLQEGTSIRISGQDCERGTFSHRHAVLVGEETEEKYLPLQQFCKDATQFHIYNSPLSEYAILGFEYGYATVSPKWLNIWEAQFGDFSNGAQIIIDQFLSCSEAKWRIPHGLVLLLPHGYEGQGPEHSSARIERFLSLSARNNMFVVNCSTPANFYHVLRRQLKGDFKIPLIIFTPKSLLRHPRCISPLEDFITGTRFQEVIDDSFVIPDAVKRVLFCSGKIYYDLLEQQQKDNRKDVAIIRVEQLYPFPEAQIQQRIHKYKSSENFYWIQEEPENMGAWPFICRVFKKTPLHLIARPESASPATGFYKQHAKEQQELILWALGNTSNAPETSLITVSNGLKK